MGISFNDRNAVDPSLLNESIPFFWKLTKEYTVRQAALLIVGLDPDGEIGANCENWKIHERPKGYGAVKQALKDAIQSDAVQGKFRPLYNYWNGEAQDEIPGSYDIEESTVKRDSLVTWLRSEGVRTGFFFPDGDSEPDYMNPNDPRYAPKLAASVAAWLAVKEAQPKKSEKQSLEIWLRANAGRFGLIDEDGNPITQAMQECSAVANWNPGGGATKTPGE